MVTTTREEGDLMSLASHFKHCLDFLNNHSVPQACSRQLEFALAALDIEKTRLLVWSNEIGLMSTDLGR